MLSPILAFTADEAWEFIPGSGAASVHLAQWQPGGLALPPDEQDLWKQLLNYRNDLLPDLETKRQSKTIGKSLEARIRLFAENKPFSDWAADPAVLEAFRELCNVSQIEITRDQDAELVVRADGQKCERCWHWETDVGSNPDYPTICGRCIEAVKQHDGLAAS
jgi:isoleucyl-tRNA synthetase